MAWWTVCKSCDWKRHSGMFEENAKLKKQAHIQKNPNHIVIIVDV